MFVDAVHKNDNIQCWVRTNEGLKTFTAPAPYYCYVEDEQGEHQTLFGTRARKREFDYKDDFQRFVDSNTGLFESDIPAIYKFISDNFYSVQPVPLTIGYFDIEVDFDLSNGKGYPTPENPFGEINAITLFDTKTQEYNCLILSNDNSLLVSDEEYPVNVYHCVSERQLLDTFFSLIEDVDILTAWNGDIFDIPYIIERSKIIYGESKALKKLCRDGHSVFTKRKQDRFKNYINQYVLVGRSHLDLLELYRKFTAGERPSFKLDVIAEIELKKNKVEYDGDLGELFRTDPKKFLEYSLHDVRLLLMLDKKLRLIELAISMANRASIKITDVFGSIKYLEHAIRNYCHFDRHDPIVLPDKANTDRQSFEGAFVLTTKPGAYSWTMSVDLASLYPSVIRAINISPETHVLQCERTQDDFLEITQGTDKQITLFDVRNPDNKFSMPAREVKDILIENGWSISGYGAIFESKQGLIPEVLTIWTKRRAETKKKAKELLNQSINASSNEEKIRLKKEAEYYDMQQTLFKLNNNSLYGAISNPHSRFYSIYLAASVTLTGQYIERFQIWKADNIIESKK